MRLRFSALQRAENSSIAIQRATSAGRDEFQCSSASRKFLNSRLSLRKRTVLNCFSALQRAENSSIITSVLLGTFWTSSFSALQRAENSSIVNAVIRRRLNVEFQCSSASRKFLNNWAADVSDYTIVRFSALQRAENSSISAWLGAVRLAAQVSVLFSEPKIPQSRPSHLRPSIFPTAMITLRHS